MATKNIESVLKWVVQGDAPPGLAPALEELNAIRAAAKAEVGNDYLFDRVALGVAQAEARHLWQEISEEES